MQLLRSCVNVKLRFFLCKHRKKRKTKSWWKSNASQRRHTSFRPEGVRVWKARFFFFKGEQSKKGSNGHVEVCVEVGEHVERLVRRTHVLCEDGDKRQVCQNC